MRLEKIKDSLPDLDGQHGRVEYLQRGFGCIFGRRRGHADGFAGALSLGAIPIAVAILPIDHGGNVSFGGTPTHANGRGGIYTFSAGGLACPTGGVNTGIDALDLAPSAPSASYTRSHVGDVIEKTNLS